MAIVNSILFILKEHSTSSTERCTVEGDLEPRGCTLIRLTGGRYKVSDEADKNSEILRQLMEIVNRRNGLKMVHYDLQNIVQKI